MLCAAATCAPIPQIRAAAVARPSPGCPWFILPVPILASVRLRRRKRRRSICQTARASACQRRVSRRRAHRRKCVTPAPPRPIASDTAPKRASIPIRGCPTCSDLLRRVPRRLRRLQHLTHTQVEVTAAVTTTVVVVRGRRPGKRRSTRCARGEGNCYEVREGVVLVGRVGEREGVGES